MSKYTFTVRKRDYEISLITDDKNAVDQQLAIWVMAVSRKPFYVPISNSCEESLKSEICEESDVLPVECENSAVVETQEDFCVETHNDLNNEVVEEVNQEIIPESQNIKSFEPEVISVPAETAVEDSKQDYVEEFINTLAPEGTVNTIAELTNELTIQEKEKQKEIAVTLNSLFNAENPSSSDFESILEKTVDNISPDTSSVIKRDENFCKLVKANNITDRLELLLFTADYFCKYDARFSFSLKQINGKLMNNLAVIVDHGILKIALDNNYIEQVEEGEYRLTEYGRSEIYSKAGFWS